MDKLLHKENSSGGPFTLSCEIIFLNVEINVRSVQDSHMTVQVVMFVYIFKQIVYSAF